MKEMKDTIHSDMIHQAGQILRVVYHYNKENKMKDPVSNIRNENLLNVIQSVDSLEDQFKK